LEGRALAAAKPPGDVAVPLPLHVRQFFKVLPTLTDADALLRALRPLLQRVTVVTRRRRTVMAAGCIFFPLSLACACFLFSAYLQQWARRNPGVAELGYLLQYRSVTLHMDPTSIPIPTDRQFAIYLASHYRAVITNNTSLSNSMMLTGNKEEGRRFAQESLTKYPAPTADEIAEANAALTKSLVNWGLTLDDFKDLSGLVDRLKRQSDPVSAFLWHSLSNTDQYVLTHYSPSATNSMLAQNEVVQVFLHFIVGPPIYEAERFKGVALRPETKWLMEQSPTNASLANMNRYYLNRFLLEDAYPREFSRMPFTPAANGIFAILMQPTFALGLLRVTLLYCVCLPALIAALVFRGGLVLLLTSVTFVRRDGAPASRLRLLSRGLVAWSLFLAAAALGWYNPMGVSEAWAQMIFGLFCGLAVLSVALPQRGLQDRLAGTWPVPR